MNSLSILRQIWERSGPGFVFLPVRDSFANQWYEHEGVPFPERPNDDPAIHSEGFDVYYTPITYAINRRVSSSIESWGVLYADLDDAFDPDILAAVPATLLTETSPGRFQAVWFLSEPVSPELGANLNRRLAHVISADHGAWIPTKVLRVPESVNYNRGGARVEVVSFDPTIEYPAERLLEDLPELPDPAISGGEVPSEPTLEEHRALLDKHWPRLDHRTRIMLGEAYVVDRSLRLAQLASRMRAVSIPPADIFKILSRLPINKFRNRPEVLWRSVVLTTE